GGRWTVTGLKRVVLVPSPSWPFTLLPQARMVSPRAAAAAPAPAWAPAAGDPPAPDAPAAATNGSASVVSTARLPPAAGSWRGLPHDGETHWCDRARGHRGGDQAGGQSDLDRDVAAGGAAGPEPSVVAQAPGENVATAGQRQAVLAPGPDGLAGPAPRPAAR